MLQDQSLVKKYQMRITNGLVMLDEVEDIAEETGEV